MTSKHTERLKADAVGVARAVDLLKAGELVAVPTETVYGLAGRADSEEAVAAIYRAKGRPEFNPLIVHVAALASARAIAKFDARAEALAERFWPGPLTLVLPLHSQAPVTPAVTAGLATVAVRMPDHPVMAALLDALEVPLAAPSANRSGAVSPTCADHVMASLDGRIAAVIDAGACQRGLESTIVAVRPHGWQLLRPGPVTRDAIAAVLGAELADIADGIEAPGQLASHYSPGKPVRLDARDAEPDEFMIGFGAISGDCNLAPDGDIALAAARLYACLHQAAESPQPRVAVAHVPSQGMGAAINDRLRRAAA